MPREQVPADDGRLSSAEAARRLGVKVETLYAYVSRGLLTSRRVPGGRGSTFAVVDVERLARSGARSRAGEAEPFRFPAITTSVSLVRDGQLYYRGESAVGLSRRSTFEHVAALLWDEPSQAADRAAGALPAVCSIPDRTAAAVRRAVGALPSTADSTTGLRVALAAAAALDPPRHDLSPPAVRQTARLAIAAMIEGVGGPDPSADVDTSGSVAVRLARRLSTTSPGAWVPALLNAALVLLADHGLAASTVAARVAASARADPYAVLGAGLGALDSPLHGAASVAARALLTEVAAAADAGPAVLALLRRGQSVPGIGHRLYPQGDPRAAALFAGLEEIPDAVPWLRAARVVERTLAGRGADRLNVDMALAVLGLSARLPPDAGEVVFAVARAAGWIAHAMEEYREEALRWRGRELYIGPEPAERSARAQMDQGRL